MTAERQPEPIGRPAGRPAFYALAHGGWRDYVTLLHLPYTGWHLSYVALGATTAPRVDGGRLGASVLAFFLAVGLTAHALDELNGRPLRTAIPSRILAAIAGLGLAGAVGIGILGATVVSWWLLAFVAAGTFAVLAYNLELFRSRFHGDVWFALAWGAFPALTGAFAQEGSLTWGAVLVAAACMMLSAAQRMLSTPVREIRRRAISVDGRMVLRDGREVPLTEMTLRGPAEGALRAMAFGIMALAAGLVIARLG